MIDYRRAPADGLGRQAGANLSISPMIDQDVLEGGRVKSCPYWSAG